MAKDEGIAWRRRRENRPNGILPLQTNTPEIITIMYHGDTKLVSAGARVEEGLLRLVKVKVLNLDLVIEGRPVLDGEWKGRHHGIRRLHRLWWSRRRLC